MSVPPRSKTPRAAVYARLSLAREDSVSIDKQVRACEARVADLDAIYDHDTDLFVDHGISAYSAGAHRPKFESLKSEIDAGSYDVVVVYELSRLSRRLRETVETTDLMKQRGVRLIVTSQPIDTGDAMGSLFLHILASFAQAESEQISARVASAQQFLMNQGRYRGGSVPYGYQVVRNPDGAGWVLDVKPNEAEVLRRAAEMLLEDGMNIDGVARQLNADGCRSRKGKLLLPSNISKWLKNPATGGHAHFKGEPVRDADGNTVTWIQESVLGEQVWDDVCVVLGRNKRAGRRTTNPNILLATLVTCATCGCTMTGAESANGFGTYSCRQNEAGREGCKGPARISMKALNAFVAVFVLELLANTPVQEANPREGEIDIRITTLRREIASLVDDLAGELLTHSQAGRKAVVAGIEQREGELTQIESELAAIKTNQRRQARAAVTREQWQTLTAAQRRALMREVIAEVRVSKLDKPSGPKANPEKRSQIWIHGTEAGEKILVFSPES